MGLTLRLLLAVFLVFSPFAALAQDAPKELRILRVTPDGADVPAGNQIVIEFNRPVVPVGQMDRTDKDVGITITPALNCQWRWINTSTLSCNLDEKDKLQLATEYSLTISPTITAEDGAKIAEDHYHKFITMRPRADSAYVRTWKKPGTPVFRVSFNQPVTRQSVAQHVYFEQYKDEPVRFPVTVTHIREYEEPSTNPNVAPLTKEEASINSVWMIEPAQDMELDKQTALKQEAGLSSGENMMAGIDTANLKEFFTYPELALKGVTCRDKNNNEVVVTPDVPQSDETLCNPLQAVTISFTAPVLRSQVKDNLIITPDLAGGRKDVSPWGEENRDWSRLSDDRNDKNASYSISLPYGLKAAQEYTVAVAQKKLTFWEKILAFFGKDIPVVTQLTDEFGRTIAPFELKFATGHRNPNYELIYRDRVLEKGVDSEVPLFVNNLSGFTFPYDKLTHSGLVSDQLQKSISTDVRDIQYAIPLGVRTILNGTGSPESGAVYGFVKSQPGVEKWEGAGRLFAQVTPFQVYLKLGHFRSTVWVTDLATGEVVKDAKVTAYSGILEKLGREENILATATTNDEGVAVLPGTSTLDPDLALNRAYRDEDRRLFVRVDKGEDMAILPMSYEYQVQLWNVAEDVYTDTAQQFGHMKSWGMTAQGIYRAGDTIQYKIYVRDQDNNRFVAPPSGKYTLDITDPTGKSVQRTEGVTINEFGTLNGEYAIPKNASVGWYTFKLEASLKDVKGNAVAKEFYPLSVLVSDFTPAPFRVGTELNGTHFRAGDKLTIDADAKLHSGGAYGEAAIRSTVTLQSSHFSSNDLKAKDYYFDSFEEETDSEQIFQKEDKLDDKGEWKTSIDLPEKSIVYGKLIVESAVRDDRGKSIASEVRADYVGVDRLVGVKPTEWVYAAKKPAIVKAIVVDDKGVPVKGVSIDLAIEKQETLTAKVKSAGSAYLNDNTIEWVKKDDCRLKSAEEGQDCTFTPDSAGTYRVVATIKDTKGRTHTTKEQIWVSGSDYVQWNDKENALTLIPEKADYKVGENARYLVKNPYPGAMAYISVERYGVIDSFVQKLEGSTPVIEVPVKADYVPGFYLSVVVMSPRVEAPPVEANQIDLGKPTFRVGYAKVPVSDPYKEITVTSKTPQEEYRPRDTVKVDLHVAPKNAPEKAEPFELAVAVLDEAVFDLITGGRDAFDPYHGFYDLDYLDVSNYSLLSRLVGRQKFEKKGANAGGDGGIDASTRNLFKFVSYWNPSVPVDKDGNATLEFEAPDNLTGWRILALATTPNDLMGLGESTFKVNRPTEIRPVMPNQVREGDHFSAGFSIMNRTDSPRTIKVTINATGDVKEGSDKVKEESITLEPYKRTTVYLPLDAAYLPILRDVPEGDIAFTVKAGDDVDSDALEHNVPVLKSRTIETAANYATTTEDKVTENIDIPDDIYTDTGALSVTLSPSVIAGLDGAFRYMRDYGYPCWEQKLSMAAMASHYKNLKPYTSVEWTEAQDLTQTILDMAAEYQAPNGGMAYFQASDQYADPYLSAYTALVFSWLKKSGYTIPQKVESNLQNYLLNFLRTKSAPEYYHEGMVSTVRAVILSALKDSGKINKNDVLRFRDAAKGMSLFGKAHYMQAAQSFDETKSIARDVLNMILASGSESGGKLSFNDNYDNGYERILSTPTRDNCVALEALMTSPSQSVVGDKPFKIMRFITQQRGVRDHWENTQENIFCMNAMVEYAKAYESEEPDMSVKALVADKSQTALFNDVRNPPVTLSFELQDGDAGKKSVLSVERDGDGRLYYATRLQYAPKKPKDNVNAGFDIKREYSIQKDGKWEVMEGPLSLKRGDLIRVDLYLSTPTGRSFVAINDPLAGGLETVNRDLATTSSIDAGQGDSYDSGSHWHQYNDWIEYGTQHWGFYHKELRHDSARFYAEWIEPGNYHLSYTAQAIASGTFSIPATTAEEMYDPDIYGRAAKEELVVKEAP